MVQLAIIDLPEVEPVVVASLGITLTDQATVATATQLEARKLLVDVLQRQFLEQHRPATQLCGTEQPERINQLYQANNAKLQDAGLRPISVEQFRSTLGDEIVADDSACDPRLAVKTFLVTVTRTRELLGLFTLYNIMIEFDDAAGFTATAMAMPGFENAPGLSHRESVSGVMRWILENDFVLGNRKLDFIQWRFPSRAGHRWLVTEGEAQRMGGDGATVAQIGTRLEVADLQDHAIAKDPTTGAPIIVRRRGARPPPA